MSPLHLLTLARNIWWTFGLHLLVFRVWADPLLAVLIFKPLKHVCVYLFINLNGCCGAFLEALICCHLDEFLATWLSLHSWSILWRWHQISEQNVVGLFTSSSVLGHFFIHELVELCDRNMFELSILTLAHEPEEYLFICVLLPLLICKVERVAWLLVQCRECICWLNEWVFQARKMHLWCLATNHLGRVQLLGLNFSGWVLTSMGVSIDLGANLGKSVHTYILVLCVLGCHFFLFPQELRRLVEFRHTFSFFN